MSNPRDTHVGPVPARVVGIALLAGLVVLLALLLVRATTNGPDEGAQPGSPGQAAATPQPGPSQSDEKNPLIVTGTSKLLIPGSQVGTPANPTPSSGTGEASGDGEGPVGGSVEEVVAVGPDGRPLPPNPQLKPGAVVVLTMGGFASGATVNVALESSMRTMPSARADEQGQLAYRFGVPEDLPPGSQTLTFSGAGAPTGVASTISGNIVRLTDDATRTVRFTFVVDRPVIDLLVSSTLDGPLVPGITRMLLVNVANPNPFAANLFRVDVVVGSAAGGACRSEWFSVGNYRSTAGPATVLEASGTSQIALPMQLRDLPRVNQDACRGVSVPFTVTAQAMGE